MAARKILGSKKKKGSVYMYKNGKYVRQVLGKARKCKAYRMVKVKGKPDKVLVCITGKKGPIGGTTKAVSLLRLVNSKKGKKLVKKIKKK